VKDSVGAAFVLPTRNAQRRPALSITKLTGGGAMPSANDEPKLDSKECPTGAQPEMGRRTLLRGALATLPAIAGVSWVLGCGGSSDAQPEPPPQPQNPQEALQALMDGNRRFFEQKPLVRSTAEIEEIWTHTSMTQTPFASVLGCADSRLAPELIFDQFIGDLFVVREAGNIAASPTNLGSLEYSQASLRSKLILVLGHTACGAVNAAFTGAMPPGNIQAIVDAITPGIATAATLNEAIEDNVFAVIETIRSDSPLLRQAEIDGDIEIVGGVYDIATGAVRFL
jgi:carbonic anhydrase